MYIQQSLAYTRARVREREWLARRKGLARATSGRKYNVYKRRGPGMPLTVTPGNGRPSIDPSFTKPQPRPARYRRAPVQQRERELHLVHAPV